MFRFTALVLIRISHLGRPFHASLVLRILKKKCLSAPLGRTALPGPWPRQKDLQQRRWSVQTMDRWSFVLIFLDSPAESLMCCSVAESPGRSSLWHRRIPTKPVRSKLSHVFFQVVTQVRSIDTVDHSEKSPVPWVQSTFRNFTNMKPWTGSHVQQWR